MFGWKHLLDSPSKKIQDRFFECQLTVWAKKIIRKKLLKVQRWLDWPVRQAFSFYFTDKWAFWSVRISFIKGRRKSEDFIERKNPVKVGEFEVKSYAIIKERKFKEIIVANKYNLVLKVKVEIRNQPT